jgi:hypothetical protein
MFLYIALIIFVIWLGLITYYLRRIMQHYNALTRGVNKKTLEEVLTVMTRDLHIAKKDIDQLVIRCDTMERRQQFHIQKIGLLRFNPFKDTGGDQSFILALLDAKDTGVVITALYSRSGTRWYAKKVMKGKGAEHELSDEEKKALQIAKVEEVRN